MPGTEAQPLEEIPSTSRSDRIRLAAFVAFLLACTALATLLAHRTDDDRERTERATAAQQAASSVELSIARLQDVVRDLSGLYAASDRVTSDEFFTFTRPAIDSGAAAALARVDLVSGSERRAYERRIGREIWVPSNAGREPAPQADRYAVIRTLSSRVLSRPVVGTELLGDPRRVGALRRSAATGKPVASQAIILADSGRPGLVVYAPRYEPGAPVETAAERARALRGWVAGTIDNRQLALTLAGADGDTGLRLVQGDRVVAQVGDQEGERSRVDAEIAGSPLVVEAVTTRGGVPVAAWVAAIGLTITLLMALLLRQSMVGARRSREIATLRARERDEAVRIGDAERAATQMLLGHLDDHAVYRYGPDLRITMAAGGLVKVTGLTTAEIVGRTPSELPEATAAGRLEPAMRDAIGGEARSYEAEAAGRRLWVQTAPITPGAEALLVITDVTGLERERAGRVEAEARFRRAFDDAPVAISIVDLQGRFVEVNHAFTEMFGYDAEAVRGQPFTVLTRSEDVPLLADALRQFTDGEITRFSGEARGVDASGQTIWLELHVSALTGPDGRPEALLCQNLDVSDRRRFEARLQHVADHDPLTGLANRRAFERQLDTQLANVRRYGAQGALLVLDLDHFQALNDTLGHSAGDAVVANAARIMRELLRESDILARLGGDEFAILLPRADRAEAIDVARRLVDAIRAQGSILEGQRPASVTASVGVTLLDPVQETGEQALVDADLAMYDAKEAGRDGYSVFEPGMEHVESRTKARLTWLERIRTALDEDRFTLVAQPIQSLTEERVVHHEVLLRMVGDDGELIPPAAFLHIAERFGLIGEVDAWVVRRAIHALAERPGQDLVFEVNLSGPSIGSEAILEVIERELGETGVDPQRVIFEITETAAVANVPDARAFAERLRELGCRFALDDFGAGFGSFYYLKHLPCDFLKIDGEFIRNFASTPTDQVIVAGLVRIAHGLGKQTIAEFVGDEETVELLRREGVDMAQGYHVGRPGPLDEVLSARAASRP